jgi:3-oxoacyl-[acyl-carrier protein] reductase
MSAADAPVGTTHAGRVAIVTGSTRGIGRAIARRLLDDGAQVVANSRSAGDAAATADALGPRAIGVAADVTGADGADRLVAAALEAFGRVDVLVNNAGMAMQRPSLELSLEDWQRVVDLNLTAPLLCAQAAARVMAPGSSIVNLASVTSFDPFPRRLGYSVTKAGLVTMTRVLAAEWAPAIRVNAVAPGVVETDFTRELSDAGLLDFDAMRARTPMGRLGRLGEVAAAVSFLASPRTSWITGETLLIEGGWVAYGHD